MTAPGVLDERDRDRLYVLASACGVARLVRYLGRCRRDDILRLLRGATSPTATWIASRLWSPTADALLRGDLSEPQICRRCGEVVATRRTSCGVTAFEIEDGYRDRVRHTRARCGRARRDLELLARGYNARLDVSVGAEMRQKAADLLRGLEPVKVVLPDWFTDGEQS